MHNSDTYTGNILQNSQFSPHLKTCINSSDNSYIFPYVPEKEDLALWNKNDYLLQSMLAIYKFSIKFTYVHIGWHDSTHDRRVIKDTLKEIYLSKKEYYVVDSGYAFISQNVRT
jgi:hypothetical protein